MHVSVKMASCVMPKVCLALSRKSFAHHGTFSIYSSLRALKRTMSQVAVDVCKYRSINSTASIYNEAQVESISKRPQKWRLVAGVCVVRMPTLCRNEDPLVEEFKQLQDQVWFEKSRLSHFELQVLGFERAKKAREKKALEDERPEAESSEEADEFDDMVFAREEELKAFKPAPRETVADQTGDMHSLARKLDRVVYLLVKKSREEHAWQMPQGGLEPDESLLECAKRELMEECGDDLDARFYSPAPHAVYSYSHSPFSKASKEPAESKVFFMKAFLCGSSSEVNLNREELVDYAWVTREEMKDYVSEDYFNVVKNFLTD